MTRNRDRGGAESVRARLLARSRTSGEEFQRTLVRYGSERLLYRLSRSPHAGSMILKGATLFSVWSDVPHRATKDIDLLGHGNPDADRLRRVFADVVTMDVERDGLTFDANTVEVAPIRAGDEYGGLRVRLIALLGTARIALQVDVGFGDAIVPPPERVRLPSLLDQPAPVLRAYRRETVISEKLHAMVERGLANTRMKDYFDLFVLARDIELDGEPLAAAIGATFARRGTAIPSELPVGLSRDFAEDSGKQAQWRAFIRRSGAGSAPDLVHVVDVIGPFIGPPLVALSAGIAFTGRWERGGPWA